MIKQRCRRARRSNLYLASVGAALGTASVTVVGWREWLASLLAALAAVALALIPVLGRSASSDMVRDWTRVRSVSEALKTEMYTYLAAVAPYRGPDRIRHLLDRVDDVIAEAGDLTRYTVGVEAEARSLPAVRDVPTYLEVRVKRQIDGYYRPRAREIHQTLATVGRVQVALAALAAALAAVTGFYPAVRLSAWAGVITTVAAAVATYVAAERYEYQEVEFTRTIDQLTWLTLRYQHGSRGQDAEDEFVAGCERVISIQNDAWMVKLSSAAEAET